VNEAPSLYAQAGVDTDAGDRAVALMKEAVARTHGPEVFGGVGGFAGLFDATLLKDYRRPLLATSTDGVGTKVALAQLMDKHDTIGQDLVGMVVDDIVVVGARPLFMTDYIACGKVFPERIAAIVGGIARACEATGVALIGGETAEHPGLLKHDEYDVAGAAIGVVEADEALGAQRVRDGDAVIAIESSGLHSNGYSLVRQTLTRRDLLLTDHSPELGTTYGEAFLEPTRLYTAAVLDLLSEPELREGVHGLAHVTGGGMAANLARVLPVGSWVDIDRSTWSPQRIFRVLCELGGYSLRDTESALNNGVGMFAVVAPQLADAVIARLSSASQLRAWRAGTVSTGSRTGEGYVTDAKGVEGGAVRLVGDYAE